MVNNNILFSAYLLTVFLVNGFESRTGRILLEKSLMYLLAVIYSHGQMGYNKALTRLAI
jgi:hypothetical protein